MSDRKNSSPEFRADGNSFAPKLKDAAIIVGWIGGLILIAALGWFLTQPARNRALQRSVNRVLLQSGDPRRLGDPVLPGEYPDTLRGSGKAMRMGVCFSVEYLFTPQESASPRSENAPTVLADRALVFTFIAEGGFFPCAAMLSADGRVLEFVPLNSHGQRAIKSISPAILGIYARRIGAANESAF